MKRKTTAARGYGRRHQAERERLAPHVASGMAVCARCRKPIAAGEPWDLGHDDENRGKYVGPEHRACNRSTAGRRRKPVRSGWVGPNGGSWSRDWGGGTYVKGGGQ